MGVPKGLVEAQNLGKGRTPCLFTNSQSPNLQINAGTGWNRSSYRPHSRSAREDPNKTAIKFPKELKATKMFNPLTSEPNTFSKNRLAAICFAAAMSSLGTGDDSH